MAVAHVLDHTGGVSTSSGTTVTATVAADVAAGDLLTLSVSADNLTASTPTVSSVSVPTGETASWVQLASHGSDSATAAAACVGELWGIVTTQLWPLGTVITVTLSGAVVAKCTTLAEFSGATLTARGTAASGTSAGGTPTATTAGTAPVANDLVLGFGSVEQNAAITGDSDTTNGSWSSALGNHTTGGSSASNMATIQQYKIVTAGGNQTYNPTGGSDSGCAVTTLVPAVVAGAGALTSGSDLSADGTITDLAVGALTQGSVLTAAPQMLGATAMSSGSTLTVGAVLYRSVRLIPNLLNTETNLSGAVSLIQDDPDAPDGNWLTGSGPIVLETSFTDPPGTLRVGAGLQEFRILIRPGA